MTKDRKEPSELQTLRAEHAAADLALGLLIATKGVGSTEYLAAEKARTAAWEALREALGLPRDF